MWELEATFRLIRRLLTVRIIGVFPVNHRSNSWAASGLIDIGDEPFAECDLTRNHGDWSSHGGQMRILHIIYMYIYICVYIFTYLFMAYIAMTMWLLVADVMFWDDPESTDTFQWCVV